MLLSSKSTHSKRLEFTVIRSIGLWHFDDQGLPQRQHSWICGNPANHLGMAEPDSPVPEVSWCRRGINAKHSDSVVASWSFPPSIGAPLTLVVLECAPETTESVAVEQWALDASDHSVLGISEAWYTHAAMPMAALSRHSTMRLGFGLPGMAAEMRSPIYLGNLSRSELFERGYSATQVNLQHGLALPASDGNGALVLLSDGRTPLAARVELAAVQEGDLRSLVGHCQREGDIRTTESALPWGSALLWACAAAATPMLVTLGAQHQSTDAALQAAGATAMLAMPFAGQDGRQVVLAMWL
jgi:hypothetical protein